jgi:hypothetical protein
MAKTFPELNAETTPVDTDEVVLVRGDQIGAERRLVLSVLKAFVKEGLSQSDVSGLVAALAAKLELSDIDTKAKIEAIIGESLDGGTPDDGSVTNAKVAADAAIAQSKVANLVADLAAKETPTGAQAKADAAQAAAVQRANHTGAPVIAETVVSGTEVDVTQPRSAKSISAPATLTFSATTTGIEFVLVLRNTDSEDHTVTLPSAYSEARGGNITQYVVPAGDSLTLGFRREASRWAVLGDPVSDAPPEMEDSDVTTGTSTTHKTPSAAQLKLAVETHETPNPENMTDGEVTAGTSTTPKVPTPAQLKLAAETHANAAAVPDGSYILWETANLGSLPASFYVADGTEGTEDLSAEAPTGLTWVKRTAGLAPTVVSAEILADGETLEVVFSKAVTGDGSGFTLTPSGGAAGLTYVSGDETSTWTFSIGRVITEVETATLAYDSGVGDAAAVDNSLALATFTGGAVTNSSEQADGATLKDTITGDVNDNQCFNASGREYISTAWIAGSSYTLTRADLFLRRNNLNTGLITLRLHADDGTGKPGTVLATSTTSLDSATLASSNAYYQFEFAGYALTIGVKYHLSVYKEGIINGGNYVQWRGEWANGQGVSRSSDGSTWTISGAAYKGAFNTYGT